MTCFEKLKEKHADWTDERIQEFYEDECPDSDHIMDMPEWCDLFVVCEKCWNREAPDTAPTPAADEEPHIRDSGSRTEFSTGAVRDIQKGKGRCDLMPLDVVAEFLGTVSDPDCVLMGIATFMGTGQIEHLHYALEMFRNMWGSPMETMLLEVSKHFEEGAEKYGENNWQKGLPVKCYINSGVRHYLKWLRGDADEPHNRAFCWNLMCAIWTCKHKPELNDYVTTKKTDFNPDDFIGEYEEENE